MRHLNIFKDNMKYYPKVLLVGMVIHLTGILKKLTVGMNLTIDERNTLLHESMNYVMITDLIASKENQDALGEYAENYEVKKFGFTNIEEFQKHWNELMQDYFQILDEAQHGEAGQA